MLLPAGGALLIGGWGLAASQQTQSSSGCIAMVGLWWLGLLLLFSGPLWHWELNEKRPVGCRSSVSPNS